MKRPLGRLSDCQGNHYRVQLNLYKWMLERYYGARVAAMFIVCLHPDNGDQPFVDDVPVIPEVEELMAIQRVRSRESRAMAPEDIRDIDPLGGVSRPPEASRAGLFALGDDISARPPRFISTVELRSWSEWKRVELNEPFGPLSLNSQRRVAARRPA